MTHVYRPWGLLKWVLDKGPKVNWTVFGCLGPEKRSLEVMAHLREMGLTVGTHILRIKEPRSRHSTAFAERVALRETQFKQKWGGLGDLKQHSLLEQYSLIVEEAISFANVPNENVILDVTSLPKRFFFPTLRVLLQSPLVRNLIVTYTFPGAYESGKLAENVLEWDHLPLFGGPYTREKPNMVVVGVGFDAFGLQGEIDAGESGVPVKLLLPFPCPPESYRRGLEMVRRLQKHRSPDTFEVFRTDSRDISDSFDRLVSLWNHGARNITLAPFGPKSISVAMCIFATLTNSSVYYTQPTAYNPDYSTGVSKSDGTPGIYAYCLRLNGKNYFTV
jgi:hypothetical protein